MVDTVIIGAGMAGMACARALSSKQQIHNKLLVLEKSRGVGGRAATRYLKNAVGEICSRIDHGAQYFTVRNKIFGQQAQAWLEQGIITQWTNGFHHWQEGVMQPPDIMGHPRFVAPLGMNQLVKHLAKGINVQLEQKVSTLHRTEDARWWLETESGARYQANNIILSMPAPQVLQLLQHSELMPEYYEALEHVHMQPCFALMLEVAQPPTWQGITCQHPVLSWLAHDSSKRVASDTTSAPTIPNIIVAHACRAYSQANVAKDKEAVAQEMLAAVQMIDSSLHIRQQQPIHRWLYAQASQSYGEPFINFGQGLFACGDWCAGNKLEDAYLSGTALAHHLQS